MDKRSLYDGLNQLESELRNTLTELVEMKHALHEIVKKIRLWRWKINAFKTSSGIEWICTKLQLKM